LKKLTMQALREQEALSNTPRRSKAKSIISSVNSNVMFNELDRVRRSGFPEMETLVGPEAGQTAAQMKVQMD
jgi:hypothetical protein